MNLKPSLKSSHYTKSALRKEKGQIVVEYVLLLVISISLAFIITSFMVSRNPDSPGFLVVKWRQIVQTIGGDLADDIATDDGG